MTQPQYPPSIRLTATYPTGSRPESVEVVWEQGAGTPDVQGVAALIAALRGQEQKLDVDLAGMVSERLTRFAKDTEDAAEPVVYRAEGPYPGPEVKRIRYAEDNDVVFHRQSNYWIARGGAGDGMPYEIDRLLDDGPMVEVTE